MESSTPRAVERVSRCKLPGAIHTVPGSTFDRSSKAIPIVVENLPEGYRVAEIEPEAIDVVFEGRKRDLVLARGGEELQVRVEGERASPGRRTISIDEEHVEHPPELEVVAIEPVKVRLAIEPQ